MNTMGKIEFITLNVTSIGWFTANHFENAHHVVTIMVGLSIVLLNLSKSWGFIKDTFLPNISKAKGVIKKVFNKKNK